MTTLVAAAGGTSYSFPPTGVIKAAVKVNVGDQHLAPIRAVAAAKHLRYRQLRHRPAPANGGHTPVAGGKYAGSLVLNDTGTQLVSWNQTPTFCPQVFWQVPDGKVSTGPSGDVTLSTSGTPGSCVALVSPGAYASGVIEADIDLPALPGQPGTIADWTSCWLTDGAHWPGNGELDAVEAEPVDGVNAVSWHSGTASSPFVASTDDFFPTKLPKDGPNLTPGWHVVDIVYTHGFFAVYYDGHEYTSYRSDNVTGDPLNIYITTSVTPDIGYIRQQLGGPPVNSDTSPATYAVKYLKVWSMRRLSPNAAES